MHNFLHLCMLSVYGLMARWACFVVQQLARALSTKWNKSYGEVMGWVDGWVYVDTLQLITSPSSSAYCLHNLSK